MKSKFNFSVNKYSNLLVKDLIKHKEKLNLEVSHGPLNCTIIDAGINIAGSIEAGLKISEICLGGLGEVTLLPSQKINISQKFLIPKQSEDNGLKKSSYLFLGLDSIFSGHSTKVILLL